MTIIAIGTHIVGQSPTILCEVTTIRGIMSRVDFMWSSGGTVLQRLNGRSPGEMSNSLVYRDFYAIPQLSTTDGGRGAL